MSNSGSQSLTLKTVADSHTNSGPLESQRESKGSLPLWRRVWKLRPQLPSGQAWGTACLPPTGVGVRGRSPQIQARAGIKESCLVRPKPPKKSSSTPGDLGAQPTVSKGRAGGNQKTPALSDLSRRRRPRPHQGVWGRSPQFQGRAGGKPRHLPYQTYAAGEDLGPHQGVWGHSPQFQGRAGIKETYLIGTMLVEKVSASLSS